MDVDRVKKFYDRDFVRILTSKGITDFASEMSKMKIFPLYELLQLLLMNHLALFISHLDFNGSLVLILTKSCI